MVMWPSVCGTHRDIDSTSPLGRCCTERGKSTGKPEKVSDVRCST